MIVLTNLKLRNRPLVVASIIGVCQTVWLVGQVIAINNLQIVINIGNGKLLSGQALDWNVNWQGFILRVIALLVLINIFDGRRIVFRRNINFISGLTRRILLMDSEAGTSIFLPLKVKLNGAVLETRKTRLSVPLTLVLPVEPTEMSRYAPDGTITVW